MGKTMSFLIFFSIVLLIYGLANYYIWLRFSQAFQEQPQIRLFLRITLLVLMVAYPLTRIVSSPNPNSLIEIYHGLGAMWIGAMLYLVLSLAAVDLFRLLWKLGSMATLWKPPILPFYKPMLMSLLGIGTIVLMLAGYWNARNPQVRHLSLSLPAGNQAEAFRMVMVSDIHMGRLIGKKRVNALVDKINHQEPDIVVLVGDMVDDEMGPVVSENIGEALANIRTLGGVYAVMGNHEYIGATEEAVAYMEGKGISFLRDTAVLLPQGVWLIGREDRDMPRFTGNNRLPLHEVMKKVQSDHPVILLDHQPYELEEKAENGVFLTLSGHTHHGQLWPLNYITKAIYGLSWGYRKYGEMHAYVSSGFGGWGPPARIGNRPEIVVIDLARPKMAE